MFNARICYKDFFPPFSVSSTGRKYEIYESNKTKIQGDWLKHFISHHILNKIKCLFVLLLLGQLPGGGVGDDSGDDDGFPDSEDQHVIRPDGAVLEGDFTIQGMI